MGLWFKCGHPFSPQYTCPDGHLRVLLLSDDDDREDVEENLLISQDREEAEPKEEGECQILDFMGPQSAITNPKTSRVSSRHSDPSLSRQ